MDENGVCGICRRGASGFDAAYSYGSHENELRELIHIFKYGGVQTLARPLGKFLSIALPRDQSFQVIVPLPMHWRKRWQRGFNQAELLAAEISRRIAVPVQNAVIRVHQKGAQAGLTNAKRRENVTGAFRAKRRHGLAGKRVLLIDDVLTTGATASACAKVLKRAGAAHVTLLTVSRADRRIVAIDYKGLDLDFQGNEAQFPESIASRSLEHAKLGSFT